MSASSQRREMRRVLSEHALMTIPEAAKYLGCSDVTARKMVADGRIPSVQVGEIQKVDPVDLFAYIVAHRAGMTVDQYADANGEDRLVDEARNHFRRVRRFVA